MGKTSAQSQKQIRNDYKLTRNCKIGAELKTSNMAARFLEVSVDAVKDTLTGCNDSFLNIMKTLQPPFY